MADSWINNYVQKHGLQPAQFSFENEGPDNDALWRCKASLEAKHQETFSAIAYETTKHKAKREACQKIKDMLEECSKRRGILEVDGKRITIDDELYQVFASLQAKSSSEIHFFPDETTSNCSRENLHYVSPFKGDMNCTLDDHTEDCIEFFNKPYGLFRKDFLDLYKFIAKVDVATLKTLYRFQCIRFLDKYIQDLLSEFLKTEQGNSYVKQLRAADTFIETRANADQPIEPATINQAATAMQIASLPSQTNPQPTGVMPAMTSGGEDIMANLQFAEHHTLQPVGAPNMLSVGAIQFDIKHLIYEQFLDADQEFEITDDLVSGSVILQIPYGVNHPFVNRYIKSYSELHGRYAGAIQYRVTVIGNPLFSGAIGIAWFPRRVTTSTVPISETQKYAYSAKGVTMPWNAIHTLHDGRREYFYRLADEVVDDERPHLVVYLMMSLQNPLREGVVTRLRVASKLCNASEPNPFVFSEPRFLPEPPINETRLLSVENFENVFVNATNTRIWFYSDGRNNSDQKFENLKFYPSYTDQAFNQSSSVRVLPGVGISPTAQKSFTKDSVDSYANFLTTWPKFSIPEIDNFPPGTSSAVVSIMTQTTMDSDSFSTLCRACPMAFFNLGTINKPFTQAVYNQMKLSNEWSTIVLRDSTSPVKILSLISNNQVYIIRNITNIGNSPSYIIMGGYIKVTTDKGTTIFYNLCGVSSNANETISDLYGKCGLTSAGNTTLTSTIARYPYLNIDEQLEFTSQLDPLPLGYQALRISDLPPSALLISDYPSCTASDDPTIERWFHRRAENLPLTQCLQFRLVDASSTRVIATVRYFQELRTFLINTNTSDAYRVLPIRTFNINIQQIVVVDRTNDFSVTDVSLWTPRTAPSFFKNSNFITYEKPDIHDCSETYIETKSNAFLASIAGGAIQGIGQGIGDAVQHNRNKEYMNMKFGHETNLQGNMFDFQGRMQDNSFKFQEMMQQGNFGHDLNMQERQYQNDLGMLQSQHAEQRVTNREQSQNRMLERGLSSRVNFLTSPGSSQA